MKRLSYLFILGATVLMSSCEYKDLCEDHNHNPEADITVCVDWTGLGQKPSGATVIFYPEDGSSPIQKTSNRTDSITARLPLGRYNILVFNQTENEYESLRFNRLDSWEEAYVEMADGQKPGWSWRDGFSREPSELVAGTSKGFAVEAWMVDNTWDKPVTLRLTPRPVLVTTRIEITTEGIQNARRVRGVISGMAKRFYLTRNATGTEATSILLENWNIEPERDNHRKGLIHTSFISFGLPDTQYETAREDARGIYWAQAHVGMRNRVELDTDVLLVDNSTVIGHTWDVTDRIIRYLEELRLVIPVGIRMVQPADDPETDIPLLLPDVEDAEGNGGGFAVTVDRWGDEEINDIDV